MRNAEKIPKVVKAPFPHVVVNDFLDEQTLDLVTYALAGLEYEFDEADLFSYLSFGLTDVDHPVINILRDDLGDDTWRDKVAKSFGVKQLSKIDMGAYVYGLGSFLLPHDDQVEDRIIAYSLHLTDIEISEKMGGALHMYEADDSGKSKLVKSIIPEYNSLIMFEVSDKSWHQVGEVLEDIQRLTVTGWYHA